MSTKCGQRDQNGYIIFCDSGDGMRPSDTLTMGHFFGIFLGFIFMSGIIAASILYCNKWIEQRQRNMAIGK